MIQCTKNNIYFNKGDVLTSNMLKLMYSVPNALLSATLLDYPNGIVSGFKMYVEGSNVVLSSGLVKTSTGLYYMEDCANLTKELSTLNATIDTLYCLVLERQGTTKLEHSIEQDVLSLKFVPITNVTSITGDRIVLGTLYYDRNKRINAKEPKSLKEVYSNFKSCLNLWNCDYSIVSGRALHPMVTHLVYEELMHKPSNDYLDFALMSAINSNVTVTREAIRCFCKQKLGVLLDDVWNTLNNVDTLIQAIQKTVSVSAEPKKNPTTTASNVYKPTMEIFV